MSKTVTISVPEELGEFIERRTRNGNFASVSEFIRQLVREDQRRAEKELLEKKLLEGLESGEPIPATDAYWRGLRDRVLHGAGGRARSRKK